MSSCVGPINTGHPKFGECLYCWDENFARETHYYFESRQRMIGPVCKHRLHPAKRAAKQFKINAIRGSVRKVKGYWNQRAWLPDYYGEPGELNTMELAGIRHMSNGEAREAVEARHKANRRSHGSL